MKIRTKIINELLLTMWLFVASFVFMAISNNTAYAANEPAPKNTPSIYLGSNTVTALVDVGDFNTLKTGSATISVTTPNPTGYTMTLTTSGANTNLVSGTNTIPTLSSNSSVSSFPVGRWGYSLDNTTYKPAPSVSGSGDTLATTNEANSTANTYTLYVGAKVANTQPSGTYTNTLVVTAVANPIAYSLSYDANGGSNAPATQTEMTNSASYTFNISSTVPTKSDYTFMGWCKGTIVGNNEPTDPTCSGTTYASGSTTTLIYNAPTATLYAMWKATSFTIIYDINTTDINAEGDMSSVNHTNISDGSSIDLYATNYSRTGYGFAGWSFDSAAATKLANNQSVDVYGPNAYITIPNGTAETMDNNHQVKLYAVWIPSSDNLQGWIGCSSMSIGDITALTDTRDNNVYAVAKLADGGCWMIENLRLDLSTNGADISVYNTNNPTSSYITEANAMQGSSSTWDTCTSYNATCLDHISFIASDIKRDNTVSYNARNQSSQWYGYGVHYNWYTATAGNGLYNSNITVPGDICPTGWHLPYGGSSSSVSNTLGGIYYLGVQLEATSSNTSSSRIWRSFPNNLVFSGGYSGTSTGDRGNASLYQTATGNTYSIFAFSFTSSTFQIAANNISKSNAMSVRCIVNNSLESYTITYDGNGDNTSNIPAAQTITGNGVVNITLSNTVPMRPGYSFAGWSNGYELVGNPGGVIQSVKTDTTLYALWTNNSCNPTATTIGTGNTSTDAICLQDMKVAIKDTMNIATTSTGTYTLKDARDNQSYTIAKLDDGNVWMTKNLNFAPNVDTLVSYLDTNTPTSFLVPASSSAFETENTEDAYVSPKVLRDDTYGAYYSYAVAVASTTRFSNSGYITSSICPKGWNLPTSVHFNNLRSIANLTNYTLASAAPYSFTINSGYRNGDSFVNQGTNGNARLWTSTNYSYSVAYQSSGYSNASTTTNYKRYGESIRCIMSLGTATVNYNSNDSSAYPATGSVAAQTNVEINFTNLATISFSNTTGNSSPFNRPGYALKSWSKNPGAEYGDSDTFASGANLSTTGVVDGQNVTFYAVWNPTLGITFINNCSTVVSNCSNNDATYNMYIESGKSNSLPSNSRFTQSGWRISEWNTAADGSGTSYATSSSYAAGTLSVPATLTLYAIWEPAYSITYNINGGDEGTMTNVHRNLTVGGGLNLVPSNFSRTGYGFAGWSTNPNAQPGDGVSIIYGPNATITIDAALIAAADSDHSIILYAVWVQSAGNQQGWTGCSNLSIGDITALTDTRDGNTYAVAKLIDGSCWTIENLRLDPAGKTLDNTNTNNPNNDFASTVANLTSSSFATCTAYNDASCTDQYSAGMENVIRTSGRYSYGGMYNWYTATAGNGTLALSSYTPTTGDLCPAGWHLPYGGTGTGAQGGNTSGGYYYLGVSLNATVDNENSAKIWASYPNNFVLSGFYNGTSKSNQGTSAGYWAGMHPSLFLSGSIQPNQQALGNFPARKHYGFAARCVAN